MDLLRLEKKRAAVRHHIDDRPVSFFDLRQKNIPECACCAIVAYGL